MPGRSYSSVERRQLQHYFRNVFPKLARECEWPLAIKIPQVILDAVYRCPWEIPLRSRNFERYASDLEITHALNICNLVNNEPNLIYYLHYRSNCYRGKVTDLLQTQQLQQHNMVDN